MENDQPTNPNPKVEPTIVQPTQTPKPTQPEPKKVYPTPTVPSVVNPSREPTPPPVTNAPPPGVTTGKKRFKMSPKLVMIIAGALIFVVGVVTGIILQSKVLDEPSLSDRLLETQYMVMYGEDWEQAVQDDLLSVEAVENTATDIERKTDINAMHTQYEVYYNDNGFYPTNGVATDASNFPGLDVEALIDPDGRVINTYGSDYLYEAFNCDQRGCKTYELSTVLLDSDELTYIKDSLN